MSLHFSSTKDIHLQTHHHSGVEMIPDDYKSPNIINWPEQHYENGVSKNDATARRYKRAVRILKKLSNEMAANGIQSAKEAPSFLAECLVFNASNSCFEYLTFKRMIREVLAELFNNTRSSEECSEWGEVNELKYLFRTPQPWTRESGAPVLERCVGLHRLRIMLSRLHISSFVGLTIAVWLLGLWLQRHACAKCRICKTI